MSRRIDLRVPIHIADRWIGDYHVGLSAKWLQRQRRRLGAARPGRLGLDAGPGDRRQRGGRLWPAAAWRRSGMSWPGRMGEAIHTQPASWRKSAAAWPTKFAIRCTPCESTCTRSGGPWARAPHLSREQIADTFSESDAAIDRLDVLMRDLVQFTVADPGERRRSTWPPKCRRRSTCWRRTCAASQIEIRTDLPAEPVLVSRRARLLAADAAQLLTFAQHRAGKSGVGRGAGPVAERPWPRWPSPTAARR